MITADLNIQLQYTACIKKRRKTSHYKRLESAEQWILTFGFLEVNNKPLTTILMMLTVLTSFPIAYRKEQRFYESDVHEHMGAFNKQFWFYLTRGLLKEILFFSTIKSKLFHLLARWLQLKTNNIVNLKILERTNVRLNKEVLSKILKQAWKTIFRMTK